MIKKNVKQAVAATSRKSPTRGRTRVAAGREGRAFEAQLRQVLSTVDVADALTRPLTRSIENLLRLAAASVGSDEASVLVRDGNEGGLKFLVAIGEVGDRLLQLRIPPGRGIAGFVFSSGQPVAVADVAQEETFYAEVDRATGYSTQTILATPLRVEDEIVGVLEFVNREGEPPYIPFTPDEMNQSAHFADAIATLVDAHERAGLAELLFARSIEGVGRGGRGGGSASLRNWLKRLRAAPEHLDLMLLAVSLRDVASRGRAERELCREVLDALARFAEKRAATGTRYLGF